MLAFPINNYGADFIIWLSVDLLCAYVEDGLGPLFALDSYICLPKYNIFYGNI